MDMTKHLTTEIIIIILRYCSIEDLINFTYTNQRNYIIGQTQLIPNLKRQITKGKINEKERRFLHNIRNEPLRNAIGCDYRGVVERCLNNGMDVNGYVFTGHTLLTCSIRSGAHSIFQLLLDRGVDINMEDLDSFYRPIYSGGFDFDYFATPLETAVKCGEEEMIYQLILSGADIGKPWELIVDIFRNCSIRTIRFALEHTYANEEYDINPSLRRDEFGETIAHSAAKNLSYRVITPFSNILPINSQDINGETPLHHAIKTSNEQAIYDLLEAGANVNLHDLNGTSILHLACNRLSPILVEVLINHGARVGNRTLSDGGTELHFVIDGAFQKLSRRQVECSVNRVSYKKCFDAASFKSIEVMAFDISVCLIQVGLDVDVVDFNGFTAGMVADQVGFFELADYLKRKSKSATVQR